MAPAGSYEALAAAIRGGANAVYFGVGALDMRSRSTRNFTMEDLPQVAGIARRHGMRSYLTINAIIYDSDLEQMRALVDAARSAKVSAIIVTDIATMIYARKAGMEVHLSTQLNVSNIEALEYYAQWADVVVPARELTLDQVREICTEIDRRAIKGPSGKPLRVELFVHGALCMAISGKCYLSLHEMNASANRGACNQVCRHGYLVRDRESDIELSIDNPYIMSPKDLKTIHFMDQIIAAGVRVFKIEGRARGPEYVRVVCECYREAIAAVAAGQFTEDRVAAWDARLQTVFNRGFWNGYYLGQRLGEWTHGYGNQALERKVYVGKVLRYFPKKQVAECLMETQQLQTGDRILITGPTTGALFATVEELRVDLETVRETVRGDRFSMPTPEKLRPSDKIFKRISHEESV
jgi:putative protease